MDSQRSWRGGVRVVSLYLRRIVQFYMERPEEQSTAGNGYYTIALSIWSTRDGLVTWQGNTPTSGNPDSHRDVTTVFTSVRMSVHSIDVHTIHPDINELIQWLIRVYSNGRNDDNDMTPGFLSYRMYVSVLLCHTKYPRISCTALHFFLVDFVRKRNLLNMIILKQKTEHN